MVNVGVVGSRESNDLQKKVLEAFLEAFKNDTIISGGCYKGADKWAEEFANKHNIKTIIHKPKGRFPSDFHNRNSLIVNDSDLLIATIPAEPNIKRFAGTEQTVREAIQKGIKVILINTKGELIKYNIK